VGTLLRVRSASQVADGYKKYVMILPIYFLLAIFPRNSIAFLEISYELDNSIVKLCFIVYCTTKQNMRFDIRRIVTACCNSKSVSSGFRCVGRGKKEGLYMVERNIHANEHNCQLVLRSHLSFVNRRSSISVTPEISE
jgi:hypothetical protein